MSAPTGGTVDRDKSPWPVAVTVQVPYGEHAADKRTDVFIQWKGTDVCFDFTCECGAGGHYDGYFAYTIQCPGCGAVWEMPATIYPRKVTPGDGSFRRSEHVKPETDKDVQSGRGVGS